MIRLVCAFALLSPFLGGCAVVGAVGTVASAGVSVAATAGGLAVSGASAVASGASAGARALSSSSDEEGKK